MRRGSILQRYRKPRFGARPIPAQPRGYAVVTPDMPYWAIPAYGRISGARRGLGTNGERRAGVFIPGVTFPTVVTGAVVLAVGMTFWHVMSEASKTYKKPRL